MTVELRIIGLRGLGEITPGLDLATAIMGRLEAQGLALEAGDVLVVTQKIVSKAEGRLVALDTIEPSPFAKHIAETYEKDARVVEVVLRESKRIVKMDRGTIICETRHGLVCANAGVDESNVKNLGAVALLPEDPDQSARALRSAIGSLTGVKPPIIITDTFGRPWRDGLVNVAIGIAGLAPLLDYRDRPDTEGRLMRVTAMAVADELASASELVMGKLDRVPVALVRGYAYTPYEGRAADLVRPPEKDLFR
jgi:coenzyme F420-0:L-glutamate ligase/coenzyme F420-1:gamma-L-glutamate ligase